MHRARVLACACLLSCGPHARGSSGGEGTTSEQPEEASTGGDASGATMGADESGEPTPWCMPGTSPFGELVFTGGVEEIGLGPIFFVRGLAAAPDGGYAVVASSHAAPDSAPVDALVGAYADDGNQLWWNVFAGDAGLADAALGVAIDAAGSTYMLASEAVGETLDEQGDAIAGRRLVLLRYADDGSPSWQHVWEEPADLVASGDVGIVDADRPVVVARRAGTPPIARHFDAAGTVLYDVALATTHTQLPEVDVLPSGHVFFTSTYDDGNATRYAPDGTVELSIDIAGLWDVDANDIDRAFTLAIGESGPTLELRDAQGLVDWSLALAPGGRPIVVATCDGGAIVVGSGMQSPAHDAVLVILRVDAGGSPTQEVHLEIAPPDALLAIDHAVVLTSGDLVLGGFLRTPGALPEFTPFVARVRTG